MMSVVLRTPRLVLDLPVESDKEIIVASCQDPLFERYLTVPWPYEPSHADFFINDLVANGWASGVELTWALRGQPGGPLLGVIGWRREASDVGYWIGAAHRGKGYMTEALIAVADYVFETQGVDAIAWECVIGNTASLAVARAAGFRYTGEAPTHVAFRDGSHPEAWHGALTADDRDRKPGWPA